MRKLVILRGIPGSGKSTWVKENQLEAYTLSSDHIRTLYQAPSLNRSGDLVLIDYENKKVWDTLTQMLEARMEHGEFVIVDATHTTMKEIMKYKLLAKKYCYRMYCVDFSDVPLQVAKKQNALRNSLSRVPESVIDRMSKRLQENLNLPSGVERLNPKDWKQILITPLNLSEYKKIHHIGDIHGCCTALVEYLKDGIKDDEYYIFTGDYIDRGIENAEVIEFVTSIMDKPNVLLLEGNHEKWLRMWANGEKAYSKEFEEHTKKELTRNSIKQNTCKKFCRKLAQCAYYTYEDKTYLVSHAGISMIPENLLFVSAKQMIEGVGNYQDVEIVEKTFDETMPSNFYQIHGHRNSILPVHASERNFNLEGQVEFGGCLRCVEVDHKGIHSAEIQNFVYNKFEAIKTVEDAVSVFRKDEDIKEKKFGNISSFNFTRNAFENKRWNIRTVTARGLYVDTKTNQIAARGYNKFFNVDEVGETKLSVMSKLLKFPLYAYVKENGYLGIIGLNKKTDELFVTTKSDPTSIYAKWFGELLEKKTTQSTRQKMKDYIAANDCTLLFEVVDFEHDPHIIDYPGSKIYLLDAINNDLTFSKLEYEELQGLANDLSLTPKKLAYVINSWEDFLMWNDVVSAAGYQHKGECIEGFVIEDSEGFMFKKKTAYYNEWKYRRGLSSRILSGHDVSYKLLTEDQRKFCAFVKRLKDTEILTERDRNICSLRKLYFESK